MEPDSSIEQKAITLFKQRYESLRPENRWWYPYNFDVGGITFDIDSMATHNPGLIFNGDVDLTRTDHLEIVRIAFWLRKHLLPFEMVFAWCKDGLLNHNALGTSAEDARNFFKSLQALQHSPLYPHMPEKTINNLFQMGEETRAEYELRVQQEKRREEKRLAAERAKIPVPGYIYLIQSPTGAYKIGKSKNPTNRMKTFGVKLPFEVEFVCVIQTGNMKALEVQLHRRFARKRTSGEWFNLDADDVAYIQSLAGGVS